MSQTFPVLFKKTNTGAIQQWFISVDNNTITVVHGQVEGKLQTTTDIIKEGKNTSKVNETTPSEQAFSEAQSKWQKQKKKGYVESIEAAQKEEVDEIIEGGIAPMLAPSKIYPIFANKLTWPVMVQPKLDGSRLIAILKGGKCTLWSRTRKRVNSLPHIIKAVEDQLGKYGDATYDGEAYSLEEASKNGFEGLMSLIRKDGPAPGHEVIEYWIYDIPSINEGNVTRDLTRSIRLEKSKLPLVCVSSVICHDHKEVMTQHDLNLSLKFEGSMIRNNGPYEAGKRSYHLQKLKNFHDAEYKIIGAEEGRGKDAGTVGSFVCKTKDGKEFNCRLKGTYERRKELFNDTTQWKGYKLTIQYQELSLEGIPRFPIGKALRKSLE